MARERGNVEQRVKLLEGQVRELLREVRRLAAGGTPTRATQRRAILDEDLEEGSSAQATIYDVDRTGTLIEIGQYPVHDWLLPTGGVIASGTKVVESLMGFRHDVTQAGGCEPPEE